MFAQAFNPRALKVGDTAYVARRHNNYEGKVTKVTASGQIVVEMSGENRSTPFSLRFNCYGNEIGSDTLLRKACLVSEETYIQAERARERNQQWFSVRSAIEQLTASAAQRDTEALLAQLEELTAKVREL